MDKDITTTSPVSDQQIAAYQRDGYVVLSRLFEPDEVAILRRAAERDMPEAEILTKADQDGNKVSLKMWNGASEDIYGMFSRNERVVRAMEKLIGGPVYLYSAKMILKNAKDGGAWEW